MLPTVENESNRLSMEDVINLDSESSEIELGIMSSFSIEIISPWEIYILTF